MRLCNPAVCGSHPIVTPYYCRLGDLLCFVFICVLIVFFCYLCTLCVPSVLWYCWLGLLTCKNRRPYNLHCVGGDVKPCSVNQSINAIVCIDKACCEWTSSKQSCIGSVRTGTMLLSILPLVSLPKLLKNLYLFPHSNMNKHHAVQNGRLKLSLGTGRVTASFQMEIKNGWIQKGVIKWQCRASASVFELPSTYPAKSFWMHHGFYRIYLWENTCIWSSL